MEGQGCCIRRLDQSGNGGIRYPPEMVPRDRSTISTPRKSQIPGTVLLADNLVQDTLKTITTLESLNEGVRNWIKHGKAITGSWKLEFLVDILG